jgi:hypothetical protein
MMVRIKQCHKKDGAESYGGALPLLLHEASETLGAQLHNGVPWRCCVL